jgi:hypothetical protein
MPYFSGSFGSNSPTVLPTVRKITSRSTIAIWTKNLTPGGQKVLGVLGGTMSNDLQLGLLLPLDRDSGEMLAVVDAIPEGVRLAEFPVHSIGAVCWCRPSIEYVPGEIRVNHKNLANGEFDS